MVAGKLGVPWIHIPTRGRKLDAESDAERNNYFRVAGGMASVPSMTDRPALSQLLDSGEMKTSDVLVNGQSGDFITGAHIPLLLATEGETSRENFHNAIIEKHFSLWRHLKTSENLDRITREIDEEVTRSGEGLDGVRPMWAAFESWEYHERQSKYVVNGQRAYEALGLSWELPLWDGRFVDLWEPMSLEDKLGQRLFSRYLELYDPKKVFTSIPRATWTWPRSLSWVTPVARGVGLLGGQAMKRSVYDRMMYFGRFRDQYQLFGFRAYQRHVGDMRNPVSLYARAMLRDAGIAWPGGDQS